MSQNTQTNEVARPSAPYISRYTPRTSVVQLVKTIHTLHLALHPVARVWTRWYEFFSLGCKTQLLPTVGRGKRQRGMVSGDHLLWNRLNTK